MGKPGQVDAGHTNFQMDRLKGLTRRSEAPRLGATVMLHQGPARTRQNHSSCFTIQYGSTWLSPRWTTFSFFETPQASACWCSGM
jgi:hypothetical protein